MQKDHFTLLLPPLATYARGSKPKNSKYSRAAFRTFTDRLTLLYKTFLLFNINKLKLIPLIFFKI
jgi:hypothetical protein